MTAVPASRIEDRRSLALGMLVVAQFFFAALDTSAKWMALSGVGVFEVVFIRYAVHVVLLLSLMMPVRGWGLFRSGDWKLEVVRGLCLMAVTLCNFFAVKFLPLTVTGALLFTMPLIIAVLSGPMLGERVTWRRWVAVIAGFIGIVIIVRPGTEAFHPASLLCLLGAVFGAFYSILTRKLAGTDSASTQTAYAGVVALACVTPLAFNGWVWPSDLPTWIAFLGAGVFGLVGHQLTTAAHRYAPPSILAPFSYLELLALAFASWLIFAQPPDAWFYVGAPIIIASGLYIWLSERAPDRPKTPISVED